MQIQDAGQEYMRYLENERDHRNMDDARRRINFFVRFWFGREVESIGQRDITDFVADLKSRGCLSSYINTRLTWIRSFFRFCGKKLELDVLEPHSIEPLPRITKVVRYLNKTQVADMMNFFKGDSLLMTRNRAIICGILDSGMRISEILGLSLSDLDDICAGACIVMGKGRKERKVYFSWSRMYIKEYVEMRTDNHPALFVSHQIIKPEMRLKPDAMQKWFRIMRNHLGMHPDITVPHALRKTATNIWINNGMNIKSASQLLGHTSIKTTEKFYVGLDWNKLEKEHSRFSYI